MRDFRMMLRPWSLAAFLCLLVVSAVILSNQGNPLALVTIGTRFSEGIPEDAGGTEGYDGQFVYYIARDPATAPAYLDVPAYRFQRILLPVTARALAFGQDALIPWALLAINLVALAAGTWLLERLLVAQGVSRWYALTYGLTIGIFGSVRLSVPEPLTYALVLAGIMLAGRERWGWSALLFALAALAKETALVFAAAYALYLLRHRRWRNLMMFSGIAVTPFVVWQVVLKATFGTFGVGSGGALATSFEVIPFAGVARIITDSPPDARLALLGIFGVILIPFVLIPTLWGLRQGWLALRRGDWSAVTLLLLVNALVLPFVPFSTYREPLGILRFIVGLQIAVVLYAAYRHDSRALRLSTIWIVTILFMGSLVTGN
ncbi:MAG: hypothetical protein H6671_15425 [Anaerolineaceae bacterium]|nr:hypothetical protein [Anaerolineaceae bacterium]